MTRLSYAIVTTAAVSLLGIASVASFAPKLIWNASASTPVGFYTIDEPGPVAVTDLVAVDAPNRSPPSCPMAATCRVACRC